MHVRAILFDVFGTLLDVHSVVARAEQLFPGHGRALSQLWRERQLQYTWLRALGGRYRPFSEVTAQALEQACAQLGLTLGAAQRRSLLHAYVELLPFADAAAALERAQARGLVTGVLSNGDADLLEAALDHAGLRASLTHMLSADVAKTFKVSPAAYAIGPAALGLATAEIGFASSNSWDACGAAWFGYRAVWVNRQQAPAEQLDVEVPAVRNLDAALDYLLNVPAPAAP